MLRPSNLTLSVGLLVVFCACVAVGGRLCAQETKKPAEAAGHAGPGEAAPAHGGEAPAAGEHGAASPENPMKLEPGLAIWTVFVFLGLMVVLGRYAWKPLLHALHEREKHLEHVLLETERAAQRKRGTTRRAPQADGPCRRGRPFHPGKGAPGCAVHR